MLLNPDKSFQAFGYGAENTFMEMTAKHSSDSESDSDSQEETDTTPKEEWKKYYYFHRFKMLLHNDEVRNVFFFISELRL